MAKKYREDVSNLLTLTSTADVNWVRRFYLTSIFDTLGQDLEPGTVIKTIEHTVGLSQSLLQPAYIESLASELTFTQDVSYLTAIPLSVTSELELTQALASSLHYRDVESVLELTQEVEVKVPTYLSLNHDLSMCWHTIEELSTLTIEELAALCADRGLRQSVEVQRSITNISITSYLQLTQESAKVLVVQVGNHINFTHEVLTVAAYEVVISNLSLTQTLAYEKSTLIESTLELIQTVEADAEFNRSLSNTLLLTQYAVPNIEDTYTSLFSPHTITEGNVTLTYPFYDPDYTIILRAPEFDNSEDFEFRRINRRTRGGDLVIHRQVYWPIAERLDMKFTNLTHAVTDSLLRFLNISIGKEIGLLDHEGRQWKGIILTPSARVKANTGRECQYSVSINFEGSIAGSHQFESSILGTGLMTGVLV